MDHEQEAISDFGRRALASQYLGYAVVYLAPIAIGLWVNQRFEAYNRFPENLAILLLLAAALGPAIMFITWRAPFLGMIAVAISWVGWLSHFFFFFIEGLFGGISLFSNFSVGGLVLVVVSLLAPFLGLNFHNRIATLFTVNAHLRAIGNLQFNAASHMQKSRPELPEDGSAVLARIEKGDVTGYIALVFKLGKDSGIFEDSLGPHYPAFLRWATRDGQRDDDALETRQQVAEALKKFAQTGVVPSENLRPAFEALWTILRDSFWEHLSLAEGVTPSVRRSFEATFGNNPGAAGSVPAQAKTGTPVETSSLPGKNRFWPGARLFFAGGLGVGVIFALLYGAVYRGHWVWLMKGGSSYSFPSWPELVATGFGDILRFGHLGIESGVVSFVLYLLVTVIGLALASMRRWTRKKMSSNFGANLLVTQVVLQVVWVYVHYSDLASAHEIKQRQTYLSPRKPIETQAAYEPPKELIESLRKEYSDAASQDSAAEAIQDLRFESNIGGLVLKTPAPLVRLQGELQELLLETMPDNVEKMELWTIERPLYVAVSYSHYTPGTSLSDVEKDELLASSFEQLSEVLSTKLASKKSMPVQVDGVPCSRLVAEYTLQGIPFNHEVIVYSYLNDLWLIQLRRPTASNDEGIVDAIRQSIRLPARPTDAGKHRQEVGGLSITTPLPMQKLFVTLYPETEAEELWVANQPFGISVSYKRYVPGANPGEHSEAEQLEEKLDRFINLHENQVISKRHSIVQVDGKDWPRLTAKYVWFGNQFYKHETFMHSEGREVWLIQFQYLEGTREEAVDEVRKSIRLPTQ